ncbi:hypothetical protein E2P64_08895 [Candidatus Bathyarchaeota archaeon]|nr:hypothetical protein E2P64_08895 [Candidatus Bathyarchaeota archaeon]
MGIDDKLLDWLEKMYHFDTSKYQYVLPVDGSEDSELLKIGIDFGPFQKGDNWRGANLPSGWVYHKREKESHICDDRGRARVVVYMKRPLVRPIMRFRIGRDPHIDKPDENVLFCVWDANVPYKDKPKVVLSSAHTLPNRSRHKEVYENRVEIYQNEFENKARAWLDERYPDWKSHSGHWDEEDDKEISKKDEPEEAERASGESGGNQNEAT